MSDSELEVMRILWAQSPLTSREIIDRMMAISDWKEGTIKSFISRLIQKQLIHKDEQTKPFELTPAISYREALWQRVDKSIESICRKDRGQLIEHLINDNDLTQSDCQYLIQLLKDKQKTAPIYVPCACPPGQCHCQHH